MVTPSAGFSASADSLSLQQLVQIKEQLEKDLVSLANSFDQIKAIYTKFEDSKYVLKSFGKPETKDSTSLIPVTSTVYVQGVIEDNENVLVDYGTGYFVERNVAQAIEFCERKASLSRENKEKLKPVLEEKKKAIEQIEIALTKKLQSLQIQKVPQSIMK